jgi:hypothetical protein
MFASKSGNIRYSVDSQRVNWQHFGNKVATDWQHSYPPDTTVAGTPDE